MNLNKQKDFLTNLFHKKIYTLSITFCIAILLSVVFLFKIPLEVMPKDNVEPFLFLSVKTPATSLEFNESEKAILVEGVLKSLPNVTQFSSTVYSSQVSFLINYRAKTNMDLAYVQIQEAMQGLDSDQKISFSDIAISKFNPDAVSVIKLSVVNTKSKESEQKAILKEFKESIEAIDEVAKIDVFGEKFVTLNYEIKKDKFEELNVGTDILFKKLSTLVYKENIGFLKSKKNTSQVSIGAKIIANKIEDVESTTITKQYGPKIKELSERRKISSTDQSISKSNDKEVVFLEIYNKENSDLLHLKDKVNRLINDKFLNQGLTVEFLFDRTQDLKNAISDVQNELIGSVLITFFVVLYFLKNFKLTSVICLSIPVSILLTIAILYLNGKTLNILTLSGLILSVGLTVDNSIVVAERIEGLKEEGLNLFDSCIQGIKEVYMPLLSSTLTSVIIFLPVAFVDGGDSFTNLLKIFQFPVIVSLIVSYFVALLFIPLILIIMSRIKFKNSKKVKVLAVKDNQYQGERFVAILSWISSKFAIVFFICSILTFCVWDYIKDIEQTDLDTPKDKAYSARVKFGPELNPAKKKEIFLDIENKFVLLKEKLKAESIVSDFFISSLSGNITFYPKVSIVTDEEVIDFKSKIENEIFKIKTKPGVRILKEGEYTSELSNQYQERKFVLEGPRRYILINVLNGVKEKLAKINGVIQANNDDEENGVKFFKISLSVDRMRSMGIQPSDISTSLSKISQMIKLENIESKSEFFNVEIAVKSNEQLSSLDDLLNFKIFYNSKMKNLKTYTILKEIGEVNEARAQNSFSRNQGMVKSKLTIYYDKKMNSNVLKEINDVLSTLSLPNGVNVPDNYSSEKFDEMKMNSNFVIYLSIFLIYLLLASLFESILIPLAILFTVPLSFLYGVFGLKICGFELDPMARLGLLILVGTAVSNAIILIDMIGRLRSEGIAKKDAIILGTSKRVDAVFMSTTASVLGLMPVALGSSKIMGIPYSTLGICIISGLIFSTALTLVIIPIFYQFFTSIEEKVFSFRNDVYR
jgi:HAE1 family hydrophobic/amphiphilic exporter-1